MMPYRALIESIAASNGLDADLVEAVVLTESSGNTDAFRFEPGFWRLYLQDNPRYMDLIPRRVSSSYGLMQVMYPVSVELGFTGEPEELFIPQIGLKYGCKKLAQLMEWAHGDRAKALGAYNAGRGGWDSAPGRVYATKVLKQLGDRA